MNPKKTIQRAVLILKDAADGTFTADLSFEPSIKGRTTQSPCVNAALRLARMIITEKEKLIAPLPTKEAVVQKPEEIK